MPMKLKTVEIEGKTYAEVKDGKPLYDNDGSEVAFDAPGAQSKISTLNREAQGHREAKEAAEDKLKAFGDIEPEKAREAIEKVASLDAGQLVAAGKVEEVKNQVKQTYEGQLKQKDDVIKGLTTERDNTISAYHNEKLSNAFATSKYLAEKLTLPASAAQQIFGANFKIEKGKIVAYDQQGHQVLSQEKPGEEPTFDEALSIIVNGYAHKDAFIKGKNHQGGGGQGGEGGGSGDGKAIPRSEFTKLSPAAQMQHMQKGGTVVDN